MNKVFESIYSCSGCAGCAYLCPTKAIQMREFEYDFMYPVIDMRKCIDCGICKEFCSFSNRENSKKSIQAYAVKNKDDIRMESSSGGFFTEIANQFISKGDIVYGAIFSENMDVVHSRAVSECEVIKMRGSKYVQSDISKVFESVERDLSSGKKVLFTGTPCQVSAINKVFLSNFPETLFTIDIVCHGVPGVSIWRDYVKFIESIYNKKIVDFKFRDKKQAWRSYKTKIIFSDDTIVEDNNITGSFTELFRYDVSLRPSCTQCVFASTKRQGDITIGDFWGIENVFPEMDDNKGVSAVLINTTKGLEMFRSLKKLEIKSCALQDVYKKQLNFFVPSSYSNKANAFKHDYINKDFDTVLRKYTRVGFRRRIVDFIKSILK
ncbi:MAG: 4Fe-4S dicluster domain-containing protein [Ruminococcaceae bacterium]|nr:4Fe-4S dicluster domain-containing protein [Oscillospiraceae bacterium]